MTEQAWTPQDAVQPAGETVDRTGAIISLVGGALLIVGALMDWATVSTTAGTVSIAAFDADGEIILFSGAVIVALALLDLALPGPFWWIGVGVFGGFALLTGVIDFFNVTEGIEAVEEGGDVSISAGLYVVLLGAAAALVGALLRERSVR